MSLSLTFYWENDTSAYHSAFRHFNKEKSFIFMIHTSYVYHLNFRVRPKFEVSESSQVSCDSKTLVNLSAQHKQTLIKPIQQNYCHLLDNLQNLLLDFIFTRRVLKCTAKFSLLSLCV